MITGSVRGAAATVLTLALAASVAACSSSGNPQDAVARGGQPSKQGVGDNFQQQNMIVSAACTPGEAGGGIVEVDGWNPRTWKHMAHTEFRLPQSVVTGYGATDDADARTALEKLCEAREYRPDTEGIAAVRSLFDQNFTKIAVVTWDPETGASHVGFVDRSGRLTDLTGEQGFGVSPQEENAAITADGSAVWFTEIVEGSSYDEPDKTRVASRAVAGGHQAVEHWVGVEHDKLIMGTPSRVMSPTGVQLSPDGQHLLVGVHIRDMPARTDVITPGSWDTKGRFIGAGIVGWVDNDTLLREENPADVSWDSFATLDIASGAQPSEPILPENDRANHGLVISPDGKWFVFRSEQGSESTYYVSSTNPGSTPRKVKPTADFDNLGGTPVIIDWR